MKALTIKIFDCIILFMQVFFGMIVIWNFYGYFQWPFRVCAYYRTKETCLVNVHYSSCDIISYSMAGAQWRLLGWNTSLCFNGYSKSLFCPCLLVKCPAVFHSWLSDVLKDCIESCSSSRAFDCCLKRGEDFRHKRQTHIFSVRQRLSWAAQQGVKLSFCLHAIRRSLVCLVLSSRL